MEKKYLAISRRYRPKNFREVTGQDAIVTTLKNALKFDRIAHAYLFCGNRGTGKTTLARVFAKALNCSAKTADFEPCGTCPSCQEIASGRSLDVLEIDGASHRGIDDIRQINETVGYATSAGQYKIFIIDEVHMLTKEAFNALLKTLEEPPQNVKFFFATTEPYKLPPTIISRCQRFDLKRLSPETIFQKLVAIVQDLQLSAEDDALKILSYAADGSLRDAESLLDQVLCFSEKTITTGSVSSILGLSSKELFFELDEAIMKDNGPHAFSLAEKIFESGKEIDHFLHELIEHFRLMLLQKSDPGHSCFTLLSQKDRSEYLSRSKWYTKEQCLYYLDYLLQQEQKLSQTTYKRVYLEIILLHLIQNRHRVSVEQIIKKIILLEGLLTTVEAPAEIKQELPLKKSLTAEEKDLSKSPIYPEVLDTQKNIVPTEEVKKDITAQAAPEKEEPVKNSVSEQSRYDTLIRFTAVELEGLLTYDPTKK